MENGCIPFLVCWADNYREKVKTLSQRYKLSRLTIRELHSLFIIRFQTQLKELIDFLRRFLQKCLVSAPILGNPDFDRPFFYSVTPVTMQKCFVLKKIRRYCLTLLFFLTSERRCLMPRKGIR